MVNKCIIKPQAWKNETEWVPALIGGCTTPESHREVSIRGLISRGCNWTVVA